MKLGAAMLVLLAACAPDRDRGVVLWHAYAGVERTAFDGLAAGWNATHPDTPLTLVAVPYDAFADKLTSAIPNGNGPDLASGTITQILAEDGSVVEFGQPLFRIRPS